MPQRKKGKKGKQGSRTPVQDMRANLRQDFPSDVVRWKLTDAEKKEIKAECQGCTVRSRGRKQWGRKMMTVAGPPECLTKAFGMACDKLRQPKPARESCTSDMLRLKYANVDIH